MSAPQPPPSAALIVGAGMTGLMIAASLGPHASHVTLVDKGRGVGGRLATRRVGEQRADHGAQFFSVRTPEFGTWVEQWKREGLAYVWSHGWSSGSLDATAGDGHARYAVRGGMNALAKHLATQTREAGATIETGVKLARIERDGEDWRATDGDARVWRAATLVLTAPTPQSMALLAAGGVSLHADDQAALEAIRYASCLCLLLQVEGKPPLPVPGALQRNGAVLSWLADNQRKGIDGEGEPTQRILTAHASPAFSTEHYDAPNAEVAALLEAEVAPLLGRAKVIATQVKRWRYALPTSVHPAPFLQARDLPTLFFAGDGFGGPRIEGAALSGMAVADALRPLLTP